MQKIVATFGGYVEDNYCDDKDAYYVPCGENNNFGEFVELHERVQSVLKSGDEDFKWRCAQQIIENYQEIKKNIRKLK